MRPALDRDAERHRWVLFQLFLVREHGFTADDAAQHVVWVQRQSLERQPFETVDAWLGARGRRWRDQAVLADIPGTVQHAWVFFKANTARARPRAWSPSCRR